MNDNNKCQGMEKCIYCTSAGCPATSQAKPQPWTLLHSGRWGLTEGSATTIGPEGSPDRSLPPAPTAPHGSSPSHPATPCALTSHTLCPPAAPSHRSAGELVPLGRSLCCKGHWVPVSIPEGQQAGQPSSPLSTPSPLRGPAQYPAPGQAAHSEGGDTEREAARPQAWPTLLYGASGHTGFCWRGTWGGWGGGADTLF